MREPAIRQGEYHDNLEDWRSPALVDVDRILYSPEFRRLNGVTQVVPPQFDYQLHDRYSHSVKVAQVAFSLAKELRYRALQAGIEDEYGKTHKCAISGENDSAQDTDSASINLDEWVGENYCRAAGLAHDLGHPPFGHIGEYALQDYYWQKMDDGKCPQCGGRSFEGNAQTMRIVTRLAFRCDDNEQATQPGLNLTLRTLAAIAKYPWLHMRHPRDIKKLANKWSFYPEEQYILERLETEGYIHTVVENGTVAKVYRWVEAEIMDWADDISYAVHDIEDFFKAGFIPLADIAFCLSDARSINWEKDNFTFIRSETLRTTLENIRNEVIKKANSNLKITDVNISETINNTFKEIINIFKKLNPTPFDGSRNSSADIRKFSSTIISYLSQHCKLYWENVGGGRVQLYIEPVAYCVAEFFKLLNRVYVLENTMLAAAQAGQMHDMEHLCTELIATALVWCQDQRARDLLRTNKIPPHLYEFLNTALSTINFNTIDSAEELDFPRLTCVAVFDYICTLSDYQAKRLVSQLKGVSTLGVLGERWLNQ